MKILISFLLFVLSSCEIILQDLQQKFTDLERTLSQNDQEQNQIKCNTKFLNTFGFAGYQFAQERTTSYCPYLTKNCCTPQDDRISELAWTEGGEILLGKRYSVYLKTLEYLLGFQQEAEFLMNDQLVSNNIQCRGHALKYKQKKFNSSLIQGIVDVIRNSTQKIIDIRKGTYCSICDGHTSEQIKNFWNTQDEVYNNRLFYSKTFCKNLVAETIQSAYFTTSYVKDFLESFSSMISCKANNSTSIEFDLPKEEVREIRNCMFFRDKKFFFFCEKYCENFNLTKFVPVFDGYLEQLKNFTRHVARYRQEMFYYPNKNMFISTVGSTEEFLLNEGISVSRDEIFIKSKIYNLQVDQLKTDFIYQGGIDISKSYKNSGYPIKFANVSLSTTFIYMLIITLFQQFQQINFTYIIFCCNLKKK